MELNRIDIKTRHYFDDIININYFDFDDLYIAQKS